MFGEPKSFYFSIMSDDSQTIENKIISEQVEVDLKANRRSSCRSKVLVMRMYQDMSFKEISESGVSINTALGKRYALMNLRSYRQASNCFDQLTISACCVIIKRKFITLWQNLL
jgi:RNA polymerase sigma-70 factor (ECF subfamily)